MRKIWTLRKDKDKRKSLSSALAASIGHDDKYLELESNTLIAESDFDSDTLGGRTMVSNGRSGAPSIKSDLGKDQALIVRINAVNALVQPDFDQRITKRSWVNVMVNSNHASEISEDKLRLCHAELRGPYMYLFKPNPSLGIRSFRIDENYDRNDVSLSLHAKSDVFKHTNNSSLTIDSNTGTLAQVTSHANLSPEQEEEEDYVITHFSTTIPHPDLVNKVDSVEDEVQNHSVENNDDTIDGSIPPQDSTSETLKSTQEDTVVNNTSPEQTDNSSSRDEIRGTTTSSTPCLSSDTSVTDVEAIIHFILFDTNPKNEEAVKEAIEVLPLFPKFGSVLKFVCLFIESLASSKFEGEYSITTVWHRVLQLLNHIKDNFLGFLLKPDVAPHILRLLELFTEILKDQQSELSYLSEFKTQMLTKQHFLLDLLNSEEVKSENPFQELNSTIFMKEINLIEFASTISFIDLKFFKSWNSNIDKSVLLQSSLSDVKNPENFYKKNPLLFANNTHIHYISRLLINHLFIENSNFSSTSSLEKKARLLEKWIDLGCLLAKTGNMSSWLGIASIILSQPVLRLFKLWSLVSPDYIKLLRNDWTPVIFELETRNSVDNGLDKASSLKDSFHIMASRGLGKIYPKEKAVPYFGDLLIDTHTSNLKELVSTWKKLNYSFNRWNEYLHNLKNHDEIIAYNDDVLRRYDSMGFIFSNESLNQVLYLGANNDENKFPPPRTNDVFDSDIDVKNNNTSINLSLQNSLLKLLKANCDSLSLEKIMRLSLILEPELPEAYIDPLTSSSRVSNSPLEGINGASGLSIHSNGSSSSLVNITRDDTTVTSSSTSDNSDFTPSSRMPEFNNPYFKIDFQRYDELAEPSQSLDTRNRSSSYSDNFSESHNVQFDNNLTFRIDDFINDLESSILNSSSNVVDVIDNVDEEEEDPGLGIDVDVILSSDKFNSITLSPMANQSPSFDNDNEANIKDLQQEKRDQNSLTPDLRNEFISSYRFIPKYATIDRLIDILLIDSRYFDKKITMDLSEYRFVFLLNYTSIISTGDLLQKLTDRFINSGNAVISVMKKEYAEKTGLKFDHQNFPNWDNDEIDDISELGKVNYELLLNIQINILKVLIILINDFYTNFALDLNNKYKMIKLLRLFNNEIFQWYNSNNIDTNLEGTFENWVNYYKKLKKVFIKKSYRPIEALKAEEYLISEFKFSSTLHEVPMNRNLPSHKNVNKIEKFLHKFNKLLTIFYKVIKPEDWIKVYKILEFEFEKGDLLEFNLQKPNVSEEIMLISNIFTYFETLTDPQDKQIVLMKFPLVFRKLFKLYFKFRSYLLIQLTDNQITAEERLDRMKTLLIMVKVAQFKASDNHFVFEGINESIPSCIETAITNVIYSPESRIFASLWIKASQSLNLDSPQASFDDLDLLLPKFIKKSDLLNSEPLLPCFGWIIENLIEANKCPNFYKNLINFNKRYLIYKIIKELVVEDFDGIDDIGYHDSSEFDFLLKLDESLVQKPAFKTSIDREKPKFLRNVIKHQVKILTTDNKKKQKGEADAVLTINHNLTKKLSSSSIRRQSLSYKSSSNSRFKISGLFGKSKSVPERVVDTRELPHIEPFVDNKIKPFAVIALKNKKIFPVYLLPFCFKVDSDNGNEDYFFQTLDQNDLNDWLLKLNYANRHWYFSKTLNVKGSNTYTTFGIPIEVVCKRENSAIPKFLDQIFEAIESEGLKDVGIYRIGSSLSDLNATKLAIDKHGTLDFQEKSYDIHTLTSIVKSYFRELPESLLTDEVIESFVELKQNGFDELERELVEYKRTLQLLPKPNYQTLKKLLAHLRVVTEYSDQNKMTASNIATVIGPALTEASNLEVLINNFGFMNSILGKLINHYDHVFDSNVLV